MTMVLHGFPPEMTLFPVSAVTLAVDAAPHPFHEREVASARENWEREIAANPRLFDGKMLFQRTLSFDGSAIRGIGHVIPYSTFLWWRRTRPEESGCHLFGLPLVISSDGAVIAIRMAQHTSNPGRVYCAAGSLDPLDIVDGVCDVEANMRREVREETGLDLGEATGEPGFQAIHIRGAVTLAKVYHMAEEADTLVERVRRHIADDPEPEADDVLVIRDADPSRHAYAEFMPPLLDWFFARHG